MKQYKGKIILTSIITLLPMLVGVLLWNKLPDTVATHFGSNGEANGWSSKAFAVFGLPAFLFVVHIFCVAVTLNDPKKRNIGKMMLTMIFWIVPVCSIIANGSTFAYALGIQVDFNLVVGGMLGILFLVLGNYMSKNQQNYTVGIRLPWTLNSEENWNKTHRLASKLWVAAGIVFLLNIFLRSDVILIGALVLTVVIPAVYSFILYKKEQ